MTWWNHAKNANVESAERSRGRMEEWLNGKETKLNQTKRSKPRAIAQLKFSLLSSCLMFPVGAFCEPPFWCIVYKTNNRTNWLVIWRFLKHFEKKQMLPLKCFFHKIDPKELWFQQLEKRVNKKKTYIILIMGSVSNILILKKK